MNKLSLLANKLQGELSYDTLHQTIYATDASVYREIPLGVAFPENKFDVQTIVKFANEEQISIIPRAAGTSLAGQVVGHGLVVDCTRMNKILELNEEEKWVRVQPGVVLDELNQYLASFNLFFGPETSTSTHCTIGGMLGNNSCGTHSIVYKSMRENTLRVETVLSNGEFATFQPVSKRELQEKMNEHSFEASVYRQLNDLLSNPINQEFIKNGFPPSQVIRRNTGYALDFLVESNCFTTEVNKSLNIAELLAGSEGTLAFSTEITLHLEPLPPSYKAVMCVHHTSIAECCEANLLALSMSPTAVELMDDIIINMARENPVQCEKSRFIQGTPKGLLLVEFMEDTEEQLASKIKRLTQLLNEKRLGYHVVTLYDEEVSTVWELRKAGLGVLGNMVGDKKPVALVEDTAVDPKVLPEYIAEFEELMSKYNNQCVFYAHISAGELHLRPILNLKDKADRILFRKIGEESAKLVAKYNGSISGEHGDGRLRGEFIPIQYGEDIYQLFKEVKSIFDPKGIFNPAKITDTAPMDEFLRYEENEATKEFDTAYDFSEELGILRAAEKCNGVGFCRKSPKIGGTMCPSFQATRHEKDSTRARANTLRETLTTSKSENPFASEELLEVLDLCLSCKACKTECPSSVDMAKLKAETLHQSYQTTGIPWRTKLIAESPLHVQKTQKFAQFINPILNSGIVKSILGIAPERNLPTVQRESLQTWFENRANSVQQEKNQRVVTLFNDEFLNAYDVNVGQQAVLLLEQLGYTVNLLNNLVSGRTHLSKGMLSRATEIATSNVNQLFEQQQRDENFVLIGLEPSTILAFRDEYIDLLRGEQKEKAKQVAQYCFTIEEFLVAELQNGTINEKQFQEKAVDVYVHGHCQQKAMIGNTALLHCMKLLPNASVTEIKSGCCGMAGSFGYERDKYQLSMDIGELVLFPAVRSMKPSSFIVAPGTSCRHQIMDGTGKQALHPVELLYQLVQ